MSSASKRARPVSVDISTSPGSLTQALSNPSKKSRKDLDTGASEPSKDPSGSHSLLAQNASLSVNSEAFTSPGEEPRTQPISAGASNVNGSPAKTVAAAVGGDPPKETGEQHRKGLQSEQSDSEDEDGDEEPAHDVNALPDRVDLYGPQKITGLRAMFKLPEDKREQTLAITYRQALKYRAKSSEPANADLNFVDGDFQWFRCAEPFGDEPYRINVSDVSAKIEVKLQTHDEKVKVYEMKLELDDDGCFADRGEGTMNVRRAWQGNGTDALYECHAEINIEYSDMTQRKGHGPGEEYSTVFWGVAANEGEEDSS